MRIHRKDISVSLIKDEESWAFDALWHGQSVGHVWCSLQNGSLLIGDFEVEDAHVVPWPFMNSVLIYVLPWKMSFQNIGVGSLLMDQLIAEARKSYVQNVWGCVTQGDIDSKANLLDWYKKRGFSVMDPDEECIDTAVKKVFMALD